MIDVYRTEEEQIAALKSWWERYRVPLLAGIGLAVSAFLAWQFWQQGRGQDAENASRLYGELMEVFAETDGMRVDEALNERAKGLASELEAEHAERAYADFAALAQAKYALARGDTAQAAQHLRALLARVDSEDIRHVATLRLARVLAERDEHEQAMELLEAPVGISLDQYKRFYHEVAGDIHWARGAWRSALLAYRSAMDATEDKGAAPLLRMKIDEMRSLLGESAPEPEAPDAAEPVASDAPDNPES